MHPLPGTPVSWSCGRHERRDCVECRCGAVWRPEDLALRCALPPGHDSDHDTGQVLIGTVLARVRFESPPSRESVAQWSPGGE